MATAIQVSVNGETLAVQLENSASSRECVQLLEEGPLTVAMRDYAGMEKVGALPRRRSVHGTIERTSWQKAATSF
ncbi:MAG: cyclophilin-like fold protein [Eggerthellaceae bacterium]|nr:cyclophilin-like fold protein [Eggerthellaceae bacterium]